MSSFSHALQTGQLGPIMKQFDLPNEVATAAANGDLLEFAKAMEAHAKSQKKLEDSEDMDTK
jgi:hypothetical protein